MPKIKDIAQRYRSFASKREDYAGVRRLAAKWALPFRAQDCRFDSKDVFDSTARNSTSRFADRFHYAITPPEYRFLHFRAGSDVPMELRQGVNAFLDQISDRYFSLLEQTNFHDEIGTAFYDFALGEMAILCQDDDDTAPCTFTALSPIDLVIEEGPSGRIEHIFWEEMKTLEQLKRRYPDLMMPKDLAMGQEPYEERMRCLMYVFYSPSAARWFFQIYRIEGEDLLVERTFRVRPDLGCPVQEDLRDLLRVRAS